MKEEKKDPVDLGQLLYEAVSDDQSEKVADLLAKGANVNFISVETGETLLITACENGHEEIVKLLIDGGADLNQEGKSKMIKGKTTPVCSACYGSGVGNQKSDKTNHRKVIKLLIDSGANFKIETKSGFVPLTISSFDGDEEICRLLIHEGADVNYENYNGFTALQ